VFLQKLKIFLAQDMQGVDQVIRRRLHSEVALIGQVAEYIVCSGGKRLRPALVLLAAGALGYRGQAHHELAAVVEFIHTATLLHDDVVDESAMRRGRATANTLFGNAASVLVGDFVYSRAFQMMVDIGEPRVLATLADATNVIAEGEVLQLMNCHDCDVDVNSYLQVIRFKTAKLFEASGRLGALLARASLPAEQAIAAYGLHLGTAFQLIDDVLDYSGDSSLIGKNIGDDLAEGKVTLPLIHVMRNGSSYQAQLIREAIKSKSIQSLPKVIEAIRSVGAIEYTRALATTEVDAATQALAALPESEYREYLIGLARFTLERDC